MAEQDDADKTEDPSGRKLDRGRAKGQVAQSQELAHWGVLTAGAAAVLLVAPWSMDRIMRASVLFIESSAQISLDMSHVRALVADVFWMLFLAMWPVFALLLTAAIAIHMVQTGLIWASEKFEFDLSRISPMKGLARLFSTRTLAEFVKSVVKLLIIGGASFAFALPLLKGAELLPTMGLGAVIGRMDDVVLRVAGAALGVLAAVSMLDYFYQRFTFMQQMRMTKHEVKDEHKQSEGDPQIKARIRSLRVQRARERMMAAVPKATVVITNPTHYAVALSYEMGSMDAPKLVAKGIDHLALRIREVAQEHGVPIVENPPLARALYATVDLEGEIPIEHYKTVAEVIGYVMRLKGKLN